MKLRTLAVVLALFIASRASAQPRPIGPAEREALVIVAKFLAEGPQVLYDNLSPDAPFRRLTKEQAVAEIEARTGPVQGTVWTLQATKGDVSMENVAFHLRFEGGVEDGLTFRMVRTNDLWTIRELVSLSEPSKTAGASKTTVDALSKRVRIGLLIGTGLFLLLGAAAGRRKILRGAFLTIAAIGLTLGMWIVIAPAAPEELLADHIVSMPFVELRELVPLRAAIARGDAATLPPRLSDDAKAVARLWILESGGDAGPGNPKVLLGSAAGTTMGELLRGRIALANADTAEATRAFEQAATSQPLRDDVVLAAAMASGDFAHMVQSFMLLADMGSRDARAYYGSAMVEVMQNYRAGEAFLTGWQLEPLARKDLARNPLFANRTHAVMFEAREREVVSARAASATMPLPPGARASICGEYLRLDINRGRLEIPNGVRLAPRTAKVLTPTEWHRVRDEEALRDAERLLKNPKRAALPALAVRRQRAADALVKQNRWADFLELTEDVGANTKHIEPKLLRDRITALLRTDRLDDARALAGGPALKTLIYTKRAPGLLLAIGDAMMSTGSFKLAEDLYRAIDSPSFDNVVAARLRNVEIRRRLADGPLVVTTAHFDIRYDVTFETAVAEEIGRTFETMFAQVEPKLPPSNFRRIAVNVLGAESFHRDIAGSDHILGLYDGEILLPYVKGSGVSAELVKVITHELTHALLAAATGDHAPRWFQEGLAQHMEPGPPPLPMPGQERLLALDVLDAFMSNPGDLESMASGYRSARTFIRFLQERYPQSTGNLIRAFAQRNTTEDALKVITRRSLDSLTVEFFAWNTSAGPASATTAYLPAQTQVPEPKKEKIEIRWSRRP